MLEKLSDFLQNVFEDEDTRTVAVVLIVIVFILTFFITSGIVLTDVSENIRCMVSPETCIPKIKN